MTDTYTDTVEIVRFDLYYVSSLYIVAHIVILYIVEREKEREMKMCVRERI